MKAIKHLFHSLILGAAAGLAGAALSAHAATATVLVGASGLSFTPAVTNINVGDTVTWSWVGSGHSSTSGPTVSGSGQPNGLWDSGVVNSPHTFSFTFTNSGSYPYFCTPHASFGMTGAVNVAAAPVPPAVTITNPPSGATFSAPASFTLAATVTNSAVGVTNVQFFQGATSLGNVKTAPFSVAVNSLAAAAYSFSAVATATNGLKATNVISITVVNANPVVISAAAFASAQHFRFSYNANAGLSYAVLVSTNLASGWTPVSTNVAAGSSVNFTNPAGTGSDAFYQVELLPNP